MRCSQCHFGETGAREPIGGWTHGEEHEDADLEEHKPVCDECHELAREYDFPDSPDRCDHCHEDD